MVLKGIWTPHAHIEKQTLIASCPMEKPLREDVIFFLLRMWLQCIYRRSVVLELLGYQLSTSSPTRSCSVRPLFANYLPRQIIFNFRPRSHFLKHHVNCRVSFQRRLFPGQQKRRLMEVGGDAFKQHQNSFSNWKLTCTLLCISCIPLMQSNRFLFSYLKKLSSTLMVSCGLFWD